jgi:predicted DNA-binding ribbon-helix-helix protein
MVLPRNVRISGRRTSVRLEPELWTALELICADREMTIDDACTAAAREKAQEQNVTSAIRSFIVRSLTQVRSAAGGGREGQGGESWDDPDYALLTASLPAR